MDRSLVGLAAVVAAVVVMALGVWAAESLERRAARKQQDKHA